MTNNQTSDFESEFNEIVEDTLNKIRKTLIVKGKEYRRNNDVFHNFNEGAKITGQMREEVLWGFALKHFVSIQDIKSDINLLGRLPTKEVLDEKYGDLIIYLILEKASLLSRLTESTKLKKSRCCGRCDGINDLCIGDIFCTEHSVQGCEICFGKS